ncbi:MAG: pyridoxamine 5'-phosphate oxidase family protein [Candidatus Omnitrophica bacterium]|nr:pyridoxamine 5'-phosphate oxidase family protein [Candidatus Omnitrophota bacterium]
MLKKISKLLKDKEFVSVATCDFNGRPNAAPKFLLKIENNSIYLVDYIIGTTFRNLQANPKVSISFMDTNSLVGYQLNGRVLTIDSGDEYDQLVKELSQREIDLSTRRIIEGVTSGKVHEDFEVSITDTFVIFKVEVEEMVEMASGGTLKREKVS